MNMENGVKDGQHKQEKRLSYEELANVATHWRNEAEGWKKRAIEENGKVSRISLLLECMKLQCEYGKTGMTCFTERAIQEMSNELVYVLFPEDREKDKEMRVVKDAESDDVPLMETEAVN